MSSRLVLVLALAPTAFAATCKDVKNIFKDNECCEASMEKSVTSDMLGCSGQPTIPGVAPTRILLGMAPDYPPYTTWVSNPGEPIAVGGFNYDFVKLMEPICGIKADVTLDAWSKCWTAKPDHIYFDQVAEHVGDSISNGVVHGCTAYTHAKGERALSLEFSHSILGGLKTAGLLVRLIDGKPEIAPTQTDLSMFKVGDVSGWAPTPDTMTFNTNRCTGSKFKVDSVLRPSGGDGNVAGVNALLAKEIDVLYMYADQFYNFAKSGTDEEKSLATGLGKDFAFIHTGLNEWSYNGTTLTISKRGSGLADIVNPCIAKIVKTKEYAEMCESWWPPNVCIKNAYSTIDPNAPAVQFYDVPMNERPSDGKKCADGYCSCSESGAK